MIGRLEDQKFHDRPQKLKRRRKGGVLMSEKKTHKYYEATQKKRLGYIGDEILPSYIGITINHNKDPVINQPVSWKVRGFFRGSCDIT